MEDKILSRSCNYIEWTNIPRISQCDEQEQDRLDLLHKAITEARIGDGLLYAPHHSNARVLDLGCGTRVWAVDVANKYPEAFVIGVDLTKIQPPNRPRNCDFYAPHDFEDQWTLGEDQWDVIYMQMGCGSVSSWSSLYRRVFMRFQSIHPKTEDDPSWKLNEAYVY
ncbi:conserved hypothetical protein [Talaromyces stipitatus ATCC 10500]|uniref:Methyltransferase domain-containing protein n=1 Tax=Talaromyces stipitatus (strain ATCC 10500 / CBS 375.48 / QM 6759 / NRRL 1006) TaxID=441959 RepID=B8MN01_TALSN|nr:uncharacterized protein TSTA_101860 [Talaromyces stipitatus ATCC 10500]EED13950.1 conserved hypothetical protein [Talaromyces stipitatus ATCC 10500]